MTHRNRPTITLLACLSTTALLTACAQNSPEAGHPNTAPPSATSATFGGHAQHFIPTPVTASGPPERPANAKGLTLAAGEQFVRYYSELLNYASETGDTRTDARRQRSRLRKLQVIRRVRGESRTQLTDGLKGDYCETITDIPDLYRGEGGHLGGSANVSDRRST